MNLLDSIYQSVSQRVSWNKARTKCMTALIYGILKMKSVNLSMVSTAFVGEVKQNSTYRKFQRFFEKFDLPIIDISKLILSKIPLPKEGYTLCMDRTNWKYGKHHINILTIGILVGKVCVPIVWTVLPQSTKNGNSRTCHRKDVIRKLLEIIPAENIYVLLMDREFNGTEWLKWIDDKHIAYILRIKKNVQIEGSSAEVIGSKPGPNPQVKLSIFELNLFFGSKRMKPTKSGIIYVVSNHFKGKEALQIYRRRWGIELLFSHLKRRGFNFEDTHMTEKKKLEKLMAILSLSFLYSYGWGLQLRTLEKQSKFLSRKSDFRYGLESIVRILFTPSCLSELRESLFNWIDSGTLKHNP